MKTKDLIPKKRRHTKKNSIAGMIGSEINRTKVYKIQERARKEISALEAAGWTVSPTMVARANAQLKDRYTDKQVEKLRSLMSVSMIRKRAYRELTYTTKVADVIYEKDYHKELSLNRGEIFNLRDEEKTIKISYTNPGQAYRKAILDTMKYGTNKEEAANLANKLLQDLEKLSGVNLVGDNIFKDDYISNISKYVPTAKKITEAIKKAEYNPLNADINVPKHALEGIAALSIQYGSSVGERAAKIQKRREEIDAVFLSNPKHKKYDKEDLDNFKKLFKALPTKAWTRYRYLYDSNDVIDNFNEMIQYDPDVYDLEEVLNDFKAGVIREDTPDEIRDKSMTKAEQAKVFSEQEKQE